MNKYFTWDRTLKLLRVDVHELKDMVRSGELTIYSRDSKDDYKKISSDRGMKNIKPFLSRNMEAVKEDCRFLKKDVERFVENQQVDCLTGDERRELGRLRREKEKLSFNIKAAVYSGIYCQKMGRPAKKSEIKDELQNQCGDEPTDSIFRKIWESLPAELKKSAGAPKK